MAPGIRACRVCVLLVLGAILYNSVVLFQLYSRLAIGKVSERLQADVTADYSDIAGLSLTDNGVTRWHVHLLVDPSDKDELVRSRECMTSLGRIMKVRASYIVIRVRDRSMLELLSVAS